MTINPKGILPLIGALVFTLILSIPAQAKDEYRLFFGFNKPGGGQVTTLEWSKFLQEVVSKKFDGFNVVNSTGYWKGKEEFSKIVTIVTESKKDDHLVASIAKEYMSRFNQESVLILKDTDLQITFAEREKLGLPPLSDSKPLPPQEKEARSDLEGLLEFEF